MSGTELREQRQKTKVRVGYLGYYDSYFLW